MTYAQKYLKKQDITAQERANLGTLCWMERYPLTDDAGHATLRMASASNECRRYCGEATAQ